MRQSTRSLSCIFALVLGGIGHINPVVASPSPIAEFLCSPAETMRKKLRVQFRSDRVWQGLRSPDEIVELWEDERGDWALVIAHANGKVCIVAMGTYLTGFYTEPHG